LSDKGWQQMRDAVAGREDWDCIVTSPCGVLGMPNVARYRVHVRNAGIPRLRTDKQRVFNFEMHGVT